MLGFIYANPSPTKLTLRTAGCQAPPALLQSSHNFPCVLSKRCLHLCSVLDTSFVNNIEFTLLSPAIVWSCDNSPATRNSINYNEDEEERSSGIFYDDNLSVCRSLHNCIVQNSRQNPNSEPFFDLINHLPLDDK